MDRRKRKSRKAIFNACVELSKIKEFQNITVNEIVEKADLNRGTFYLHFNDKFDMMNSFEDEMIEKIEMVLLNNIPKEDFQSQFIISRYHTIIHILQCYEENKELVRLLINSGHSTSFQMKLRTTLKEVLLNKIFINIELANSYIPIDLFVMLFTSMSLNLAEYSYDSPEKLNNEQLAQFLVNIMIQGPAKTLGFITDENKFTIEQLDIQSLLKESKMKNDIPKS